MLNWNEIRTRANAFAHDWQNVGEERAESQSFWNEFFNIFGKTRRQVAVYEKSVTLLGERRGRIDLLWPGMLLVEHKSAGIDPQTAENQVLGYLNALSEKDLPRYYLLCNFTRFILCDLEGGKVKDIGNFELHELPDKIELFGFMADRRAESFKKEKPADIEASERMGDIYTALKNSGYQGDMDVLLVRLLFCLFADDTGIFEEKIFHKYLLERTNEDGGDLGYHLAMIFQTLNTNKSQRQNTLDEDLQKFPHVNGELFADDIKLASFDATSRDVLLRACEFDWSKISPAIFGSLFQSVRDSNERRQGGEHYTSEENIMKIIRPLFLDDLQKQFKRAGTNKNELSRLHDKIAALTFLDPACGCGNFLIVAYRELRLLEMKILDIIHPRDTDGKRRRILNIADLCKINVSSFYGIEIDGFPARIAQVALWLVDHQMNKRVSELLGGYLIRIPLTTSPHISCGNALTLDWRELIAPEKCSYILGNPPFIGNYLRSDEQKADLARIYAGAKGVGILDYVAAWYILAARYIRGTSIRCAFVSTNSITQGDQVSALWNLLYGENIKIHFAHRTFIWNSEARGKAHVHVVIIGFGNTEINNKVIYEYPDIKGEPQATAAATINGYLLDADNILVMPQSKPLCDVPPMVFGSKPTEDGNFLFSDDEKDAFLRTAPQAAQFIRPAINAKKYLNNENRWCLWLTDAEPSAFRKIAPIMERIRKVEAFRAASRDATTRKDAATPHLFQAIRQPDEDYILVPRTTSENRQYVPMGFFSKDNITLSCCSVVPGGDLYHFGVLISAMHMAWMRTVCGRLKSDYRYSGTLVYNTFPWPQKPTDIKKEKVKQYARAVLSARANHHESTLADMYSTMPKDLFVAHRKLDRAVDLCYRPQTFPNERVRLEYLFTEYHRLTAPIAPAPPKKRRTKRKI